MVKIKSSQPFATVLFVVHTAKSNGLLMDAQSKTEGYLALTPFVRSTAINRGYSFEIDESHA
jgi:hypothetical protein